MVYNLSDNNSLVGVFVAELRDINTQANRKKFRNNLERLGEIFAYEISKELEWEKYDVNTPLGSASCIKLKDQPVLGAIIRAGLPLHNGLLNFFNEADNSFIAAYRKHNQDGSFDINMEYITSPSLTNRTLILCDPMVATGSSMLLTLKELLANSKPMKIHVVCAIASSQGIKLLNNNFPEIDIWTGAIDEELTAKSYIVPGLGDAGDLAFGEKLQE